MIRWLTPVVIGTLLWSASAYGAGERSLVLVTGSKISIKLSSREIRLLFLGRPLLKQGLRIEPVQNKSSDLVQEVFLQKVVFMSQQAYERQLVSHVFRFGGRRPKSMETRAELATYLAEHDGAVSFMWLEDVEEPLMAVSTLWVGEVQ